MKFAITVAELKPGKVSVLVGPEVPVPEHRARLNILAAKVGAGSVPVWIMYSNGTRKRCKLAIEPAPVTTAKRHK